MPGKTLKTQMKLGPHPLRRGSLDLSRTGIQSPKRARRAVFEVRTVPTNPFENTENSALGMGVSVVRKGDDGGGNATAVEPSLDVSSVTDASISHAKAYPVDPGLTTSCAVPRTGSRDFSLRDT